MATKLSEPVPGSLNQERYSYRPLNNETCQIRILQLFPGTWTSPIRIKLNVVELKGQYSPPHYEALSYTWGDTNDTRDILVSDGLSSCTLSVTKNCEDALRYLRHDSGERRVLWIDAICINQLDMEERSSQVGIMVDVYACARRVIVWVGEADDHSRTAMKALKLAGSDLVSDPRQDWYEDLSKSDIDALRQFVQGSSWFSRLWIWQEVWSGNHDSVLMCGHDRVSWDAFCATIIHIRYHFSATMPNDGTNIATAKWVTSRISSLDRVAKMTDRRHEDSLKHLINQRECSCSDDRDRIYTAQNLARMSNCESYWSQPDYSKTVQEVYISFAINHFRTSRSLELLNHCRGSELDGLPSWTPDWSSAASFPTSDAKNASGPSQSNVEEIDNSRLRVRGIVIDHTKHVTSWDQTRSKELYGGETHDLDVIEEALEALRSAMLEHAQLYAAASVPAHDNEKLISGLCAAGFGDPNIEPLPGDHQGTLQDRAVQRKVFQRILSKVDEEPLNDRLSSSVRATLGGMLGVCAGRAFVQSSKGFFVLAPAAVEQGDTFAILLGCDTVVTLRPTSGTYYSILGSANFFGYMDAEALLGPFPSDYVLPRGVHGTYVRSEYAFKHKQTGVTQREDPRLANIPLPQGWVGETDPHDALKLKFKNESTGEIREWLQDPRCEEEELEKRGVKLQTFDLI